MLLSTTYFGPVEWWSHVWRQRGATVTIEASETFPKQTYRNRMVIAAEGGPLSLTIPVEGTSGKHQLIRDLRIAEHGRWRHLHWQALVSAYGESPFFEYYQDDLRPFYFDCGPQSPFHRRFLLDYNEAGMELVCRLLDIDTRFTRTTEFRPPTATSPRASCEARREETDDPRSTSLAASLDYRYTISPKHPSAYQGREYWQVYRERHGFLPNLSVLDLLFCQGPEAVLYL